VRSHGFFLMGRALLSIPPGIEALYARDMTQQSLAAVQRRRNKATLGMLGAVLVAGALAAFSSPAAKQKTPEPPAPAAKPAPAQPAVAAPAKPKPARPAKPPPPPLIDEKVIWADPPEWKRLPSSGMRYASYEIPAAKGDKVGGELNVFILSGDVEANIQRWVDEFSKFDLKTLVRSHRTVNDMPQAVVEIPNGHFNGGMGDTKESDNYGLLGAIIVAPSGAEFFFKLTAPSKTVKAARKPFYALLDSVRVEKGATKAAGVNPAEVPAGTAPPPSPPPPPPAP
jgi:hypothetical protein